jgi:hypothetical protein
MRLGRGFEIRQIEIPVLEIVAPEQPAYGTTYCILVLEGKPNHKHQSQLGFS